MSDPNTPEQVIAEHADFIASGYRHCTCGTWDSGRPATKTRGSFATHVLSALREAGYEVVKLPEPGEFSPDGAHWNDYPFVVQKGTDIFVGAKFEYVYEINSTEARNVAAALLAAARAAEEQGDQS